MDEEDTSHRFSYSVVAKDTSFCTFFCKTVGVFEQEGGSLPGISVTILTPRLLVMSRAQNHVKCALGMMKVWLEVRAVTVSRTLLLLCNT